MTPTATPASLIPTTPGAPYKGCYYVDRIRVSGLLIALFIAPAAIGRHKPAPWHPFERAKGAGSFADGMGNTMALAEAGSPLAEWALSIEVEGNRDFFIPATDQLERVYRALKPTAGSNSLFMRSGINLHAEPPAHPYSAEGPQQTDVALFRKGEPEEIEARRWWTSTQNAGWDDYAWAQYFGDGCQGTWNKNNALPALGLRRIPIR